jgi:hypothetical protein
MRQQQHQHQPGPRKALGKHEALRQVRLAKSAHIRWRACVQAMAAGLDVDERHAPLHHKECAFGGWFYGEGFRAFGHWQIYQDIDYAHEFLHAVYRLAFDASARGEQARAVVLAEQVVGISHSLLEGLALLEEEIQAAREDSF